MRAGIGTRAGAGHGEDLGRSGRLTARIAAARQVHRATTRLVFEEDRRPLWRGPPVTPLGQRHDHHPELATLLGQNVFVGTGRFGRRPPDHQPVGHEAVQALGEDVRRDPEPALEIREARHAGEDGIADDEQAPALAHQLESARRRTA
ncbi:MAG: hypothetical protein WKF58_15215 [Ilumatobacteraceae bacterium]